jgi:hypothetical protein
MLHFILERKDAAKLLEFRGGSVPLTNSNQLNRTMAYSELHQCHCIKIRSELICRRNVPAEDTIFSCIIKTIVSSEYKTIAYTRIIHPRGTNITNILAGIYKMKIAVDMNLAN